MRKNQKGFTLVELLVVIAILAILATVAVVGYTSFIEEANKSVDQQVVAQMNTALQAASVEGRPENRTDLLKLFDKHDIDIEKLSPVTEGYAFYWDKEANKIVIVKNGDDVEADWSLLTSNGYGKKLEVTDDTTVADIRNAIAASSEAEPALLVLKEDVTLAVDDIVTAPVGPTDYANKNVAFYVEAGKCLIIDLGGHTLTANGSDIYALFATTDGNITVKNGNIDVSYRAFQSVGGRISMDGVNVKVTGDANGTAIMILKKSDISIINSKINAEEASYCLSSNASREENFGSRIYLKDTDMNASGAAMYLQAGEDIVIDGGTFKGKSYGAFFRGNSATIRNATFAHELDDKEEWGVGSTDGVHSDIVFACGGTDFGNYEKTGNYVCENVTATKVTVHEPEGGTVNVSGITVGHRCEMNGGMCNH